MSQKNDTDVAHYNFGTDQPILTIFGREVAERVYYQTMICYHPLSLLMSLHYLGKHELPKIVFSVMLYTVCRKRNGQARK